MRAYLGEAIVIPFCQNVSGSTVSLKFLRLSDGFWYDFNDSTFKDSAWVADSANMTQDSNNVWTYDWTTPRDEDKYQIVFVEGGIQYTGPVIEVAGGTMFVVVDDVGNTASTFKTDLTETTDNHYKGPSLVKIITGALKGQTRRIDTTNGYNGTTKFITVADGFSAEPSASDKGVVVNI